MPFKLDMEFRETESPQSVREGMPRSAQRVQRAGVREHSNPRVCVLGKGYSRLHDEAGGEERDRQTR